MYVWRIASAGRSELDISHRLPLNLWSLRSALVAEALAAIRAAPYTRQMIQ
ncbi:MAG: hypothetical protein LBJ36_09430 [Synergistaceae bacterium]|nr:hypothetical protein [Synergistaceae bacterium]